MSAQIITALRKRADALDAEAQQLEAKGLDHAPEEFRPAFRRRLSPFVRDLRLIAAEFRALADEAEKPQ